MTAISKKTRKVALVYEGIAYGGTEEYILLLLRYLDRERYDPFVVTTGYNYRFCPPRFVERVKDFHVPFLFTPNDHRSRFSSFFFDIHTMQQLFREQQTSIVHLHTQRPDGGRRASFAARIAGVAGLVRSEHLPPSSNFYNCLTYSLKLYDYLTDYIIAGSESCLNEQLNLLHRDAKKTMCIFYGIELDRFNPHHDTKIAKQQLGLDPQLPVVGMIARLSPEKGYEYFISAAAKIIQQHGPVHFLIVGNGPMEQELRTMVAEHQIEQYVHFAGFQPDTVPYIQAMDVAVMTSISEGISLAMLEFMAMGKAIVATSEPSFMETIIDGESGVIAQLKDSQSIAESIVSVLEDPALAQSLQQKAYQRVHQYFDIRTNVRKLMDVYDSVLEHKMFNIACLLPVINMIYSLPL
jgi:glycosyltransferase involved in cell wall biosynthesis